MTAHQDLKPGIYRIRWKSGGTSVAAVGVTSSGERWLAPTNWASGAGTTSPLHWEAVAEIAPLLDDYGNAIPHRTSAEAAWSALLRTGVPMPHGEPKAAQLAILRHHQDPLIRSLAERAAGPQ